MEEVKTKYFYLQAVKRKAEVDESEATQEKISKLKEVAPDKVAEVIEFTGTLHNRIYRNSTF